MADLDATGPDAVDRGDVHRRRALYLASWYQPWWLVYFGAWILVLVTLVAEAGRSMEARRAARRG